MPDLVNEIHSEERRDEQATDLLTFQLIVLMNLVTKPFNTTHGARHGISLSEWRCIIWLAANPGASGQATADGTGMDRMNVSRCLRSLEQKEMTQRAANQRDKKQWNWRLSTRGWSVYDQIWPAAIERDAVLQSGLNSADKKTLSEFLANAKHMFEKMDG